MIYGTNKGSDGEACLVRVAVAAKGFCDFESYMARANADVFGISDAKIYVPDAGAVGDRDAKMVVGNEAAGIVSRDDAIKPECDIAEG